MHIMQTQWFVFHYKRNGKIRVFRALATGALWKIAPINQYKGKYFYGNSLETFQNLRNNL